MRVKWSHTFFYMFAAHWRILGCALCSPVHFCKAMGKKSDPEAAPAAPTRVRVRAKMSEAEADESAKLLHTGGQDDSGEPQPQESQVPPNKRMKQNKEEELVEITAEALEKMKGAEDSEVEEFWMKCSSRQHQVLWKKFQSMRKAEGTEVAYQDATKGVGRNAKTKSLIKMWLKYGSSKHPVLVQHMTELRTTDTFKSTEKWVPLETIKQKYGAEELKARVHGGSILVRKSESDPRFPEFRDLSEEKETKTQKVKSKQSWLDGKGSWDDFKAVGDMEVAGHFQLEFNNEDDKENEDDDEEEDEGDARALALSFIAPEETKQGKKAAAVKDALKSFETASAMQDKDSVPAKALVACQKKLQKHLGQLSKKASGHVKAELQEQLASLAQVKADTPCGVAKRALNAAAAIGKMALKASSEEAS